MSKFWIKSIQLILFLYNTSRIISCLLQIVSSILIKRSIYWIRKLNFRFASIDMTEERTVCPNISVKENHFDDDDDDDDSSMISSQQGDKQSSSGSFQQQEKQLVDQPPSFRSSQNLNRSGSGIRNALNASDELDVDKENGENFSKTNNVCSSKLSSDGITRATYCPHCQHANGNGTNNNKQWPLLYPENFNITDNKFIEKENNSEFPLSTSSDTNAQIGDSEKSVIKNKEISDTGSFIKTYNCGIGQSFISGSDFGNSIYQVNQHIFLDYQRQEKELGNSHIERTKSASSNLFLGNFGDVSINNELLIGNEKYQTFDEEKKSTSIDLISWQTPGENLEFQANQIENKQIAKTFEEKDDFISGDIDDIIAEQDKGDSTHLTGSNIKEIPNEESMLDFCDVERDALSCVLKEDNASKNGTNTQQNGMKQIMKKPTRSGNVSSKTSDKMSSLSFLIVADYDAGELEHKQLENECNNNHEIKNHHSMVFGLCSDCVPVESDETVKDARAMKTLPKCSRSSTTDRQSRHKPRNANRKRMRQKNALKKTNKTDKKRVTFSEKINIFSYNPDHSVFETYYGPLEKERNNTEQITKAPEKKSEAMIGDVAQQKSEERASTSYYPPVLKMDSQATEIRNPSIETKETPSEIQKSLTRTKNPLVDVPEPPYYENLGFISDHTSSCLFEIGCIDDADPTFEEDDETQLMSEKACLIGDKNKSYDINFSDIKRQTQSKTKKWLKNSSISLKNIVYKKFKTDVD